MVLQDAMMHHVCSLVVLMQLLVTMMLQQVAMMALVRSVDVRIQRHVTMM
jgi:hypothetical protein